MKKYRCLVLVILLTCCTHSPTPTNRIVRLATAAEPCSQDPQIGRDVPSSLFLSMFREGLFRIGNDGIPYPALAREYTRSENGKTYTFFLRETHWSNGERLTAHDFVNSWQRATESEFCGGAQYFACLRNYTKVREGKASASELGVAALDEDTLVVQLEHPVLNFLEITALTLFHPVHSKYADTITNGPFLLTEWRPQDRAILKKNPLYWDAGSVQIDGIELAFIQDMTTQLQMFELGELDWVGNPFGHLPESDLDEISQRYDLHSQASAMLALLWVNTEVPPLNNKKVRRAFSNAIDRQALASTVLRRRGQEHNRMLPRIMTSERISLAEEGVDEEALSLFQEGLAELGLSKELVAPITIQYPTGGISEQFVQALQQQCQATFQIPIRIGCVEKF